MVAVSRQAHAGAGERVTLRGERCSGTARYSLFRVQDATYEQGRPDDH